MLEELQLHRTRKKKKNNRNPDARRQRFELSVLRRSCPGTEKPQTFNTFCLYFNFSLNFGFCLMFGITVIVTCL